MADPFSLWNIEYPDPPTQESASSATSSSPLQPFPDFETELFPEPGQLDPTVPHEVDLRWLNPLPLTGLVDGVREEFTPPGLSELKVAWVDAAEGGESDDGMKEATERALKWARMRFGENANDGPEGRPVVEETGE